MEGTTQVQVVTFKWVYSEMRLLSGFRYNLNRAVKFLGEVKVMGSFIGVIWGGGGWLSGDDTVGDAGWWI